MIQEKFLKVTQDSHFFDKHKRILVAVSGGKDSMNLLHLLYQFQTELAIEIGIAHVNHQQRIQSQEEEDYLRNWAQDHQIPFFTKQFTGKFSEKTARDFRYQFFAKVMQHEHYTALVTAHHADDQAETIFMRILRGSRLLHLPSMQAVQDFAGGQLIRPFLSFRKSELEDLFHFTDESNSSSDFLRNRIRNRYLPSLQAENPQFSQALIDLGQESQLLYQAFRDLVGQQDVTDLAYFQKQSPAVQYFLLQTYLKQFPDLQVSKSQFQEVLGILQKKANYCHSLKNGYLITKDYTHYKIEKISPKTDSQIAPLMIESGGIFHFSNYELALDTPLENPDQVFYLEHGMPVTIRLRQPGDRILMNGINKKVSRYFIDQKIPTNLRDQLPLVEQNGRIYGIFNIVASDLSKSLKNGIIKSTLSIKMKE